MLIGTTFGSTQGIKAWVRQTNGSRLGEPEQAMVHCMGAAAYSDMPWMTVIEGVMVVVSVWMDSMM